MASLPADRQSTLDRIPDKHPTPINVKTYGYDPFKINKILDNKPDKDTPNKEPTKNLPYNAVPLNNLTAAAYP